MGGDGNAQQEKEINLDRVEPLVSETWCGESLDMLYTRLTVVVQTMAQASTLNNRLAKCATHYDLLVAVPTDDKTLHFCCNTMNVCGSSTCPPSPPPVTPACAVCFSPNNSVT